jgi:hypothetical protein
MPYCPNCGRYISLGDTSCPECGCSLADGTEDSPGPQHESRDDGTESRREEREPRRGETPTGSGRNADQQTGKTRRVALAYAGGALGLTVLGTWALGLFDDEGPKDAIEAWRTAWASGDDEAYREFLHSESPRQTGRRNDDQSRLATADESLRYVGETREVLDRTDTEASVRDVYLLTRPEFENPRRITDVIDLRTEEGDWRIWDYRTEQSEQATNCSRSVTVTGLRSLECE